MIEFALILIVILSILRITQETIIKPAKLLMLLCSNCVYYFKVNVNQRGSENTNTNLCTKMHTLYSSNKC